MHNMNYGLTLLMYLWVSVCMWVCVCVHTSWNSEAVLDRWTKPWFIRNPSDKVGQVQSVMVFSSRYRFTLPFLLLLLSPDPHSLTLSLSLSPSLPLIWPFSSQLLSFPLTAWGCVIILEFLLTGLQEYWVSTCQPPRKYAAWSHWLTVAGTAAKHIWTLHRSGFGNVWYYIAIFLVRFRILCGFTFCFCYADDTSGIIQVNEWFFLICIPPSLILKPALSFFYCSYLLCYISIGLSTRNLLENKTLPPTSQSIQGFPYSK